MDKIWPILYATWNSSTKTYVKIEFTSHFVVMTCVKPFKRQPHKMVKHTQTIRRLLLTNCLSVFDHFVGLALKGLIIVTARLTTTPNAISSTTNVAAARQTRTVKTTWMAGVVLIFSVWKASLTMCITLRVVSSASIIFVVSVTVCHFFVVAILLRNCRALCGCLNCHGI